MREKVELILIRHGKTAGNARKAYIGRTDEPLCEEGMRELTAIPPDRSVRTVYVTDLLRTQQTAQHLFPKAERIILPDMREMDFGVFEGRSADDMVSDERYREWVDGNCQGCCPEGESMEMFARRIEKGFLSLVARAEDASAERIIFVTHGGVIMALMSAFSEEGGSFYDYWVPNLCGYRAEIQRGSDGRPVLTGCREFRPSDGKENNGTGTV